MYLAGLLPIPLSIASRKETRLFYAREAITVRRQSLPVTASQNHNVHYKLSGESIQESRLDRIVIGSGKLFAGKSFCYKDLKQSAKFSNGVTLPAVSETAIAFNHTR
jgi:hypothetical protein